MIKTLSPILSPLLAVVLVLSGLPVAASPQKAPATALVSTQDALHAERANKDRERIDEVLARKDVQNQLLALGVDLADVEARVDALSDEEARQMAEELDELPAGASVGYVVGVLFVIFAILLVTDILGLTDVYPFTR